MTNPMELVREVWREVPDFPGWWASSLGYVRRGANGKPTRGSWHKRRFIHTMNGKSVRVHRIVCTTFNGLPPPDKPLCMHMDEGGANNAAVNLKWGTNKENMNFPLFKERFSKLRMSPNWRKIGFPEAEVIRAGAAGSSVLALAREYGASENQILRIIKGQSWAKPRRKYSDEQIRLVEQNLISPAEAAEFGMSLGYYKEVQSGRAYVLRNRPSVSKYQTIQPGDSHE